MSKNENISTNSLLQEFIETILEAEGGNDLYNTFIQPFVDVGITAAYGLEKLSAQVLTVVKGFFLGLPTLFVPFLEYDYEAFREEEAEKVENVKKKYEKTLQANLDAIVSNDAFGLAFLLAPATVMGAQLAVKAPMTALKVFDVLTGGLGLFKGIQQTIGVPLIATMQANRKAAAHQNAELDEVALSDAASQDATLLARIINEKHEHPTFGQTIAFLIAGSREFKLHGFRIGGTPATDFGFKEIMTEKEIERAKEGDTRHEEPDAPGENAKPRPTPSNKGKPVSGIVDKNINQQFRSLRV
jgi:hypothetical protein